MEKFDVALLDWGIGGTGFYKLMKKDFPALRVLYFSDTGAVPYGRLSRLELTQRLETIIGYLLQRGIPQLIVACNAMSSVLGLFEKKLQSKYPQFSLTGVIQPTLEHLAHLNLPKTIGFFGGRRTILSGSYSRPLRALGFQVLQRVAQPLSAFIEEGKKETTEFSRLLANILQPLKKADVLVPVCTHYTAALPLIQHYAPHCTLLDPAQITWDHLKGDFLKRFTQKAPQNAGNTRKDLFVTTGDVEQMVQSSLRAFGVEIETTEFLTL